ncbi:cardioacceleratory peptide receptor-like isoform X3 [Portunus trituberculatus]|uniref:cardioacceleratory peptide receptor-like isoform X3 n=1 Tax=Portunus trituberculatus TaxID=210409 RepID=UPI001E1D058A|nr:cardioacceleratory peptide receptor-like isoform X3 [Portunus trituberculatus]
MSGQVTGVPTTALPEATTQGPMGGGGTVPDDTGVLVEGGGPMLEEDGGEALLELNCSVPCGNYTAPTNTSNVPGDSYYFYETEQFAVMWILFISIVVGNVAVIIALLLSKTRKSRTNFFIMHLALADLSVGLISVLTDIVWKSTVSWNAGNIACKTVRFAQVLVTYSSTYVLVALSIDRYDAITHPMNFSGSWRRARRLVAGAWVLSAIFASPSLVFFMETSVDGVMQCWIDFPKLWQWKLYMTLVALTVFLFPTVIIAACYAVIVYTIWSKGKVMTVTSKALGARNGEKRGANPDDDSRRASSRGLIPKAKIKTVKMTLVIVFVFILCWSPYIVFDLLQVYGYVPQSATNIAVATFIQSLAPLNSAANPIIYCLFSTHICRNLRWGGWGRIPAVEWVVVRFFPCLECSRQPLEPRHTLHRYGTDYTSVSDASTRRHTANSVRYTASTSTASTASQDPKPPNSTRNGLAQSPAATKGKAGSTSRCATPVS